MELWIKGGGQESFIRKEEKNSGFPVGVLAEWPPRLGAQSILHGKVSLGVKLHSPVGSQVQVFSEHCSKINEPCSKGKWKNKGIPGMGWEGGAAALVTHLHVWCRAHWTGGGSHTGSSSCCGSLKAAGLAMVSPPWGPALFRSACSQCGVPHPVLTSRRAQSLSEWGITPPILSCPAQLREQGWSSLLPTP